MKYRAGDVVRLPDGHLVALTPAVDCTNPWVGLTWSDEDGNTAYVDDEDVTGDLVFRGRPDDPEAGYCQRHHACVLLEGHAGDCDRTGRGDDCAACRAVDAELDAKQASTKQATKPKRRRS